VKKNILFIDKSKIFAGAEYSLLNLIDNLDRSKYNAIICSNYFQEHQLNFKTKNCLIISRNKKLKWWMGSDYSPKSPRGTDLFKRLILSIQLIFIIRKHKINICHFNLLRNSDMLDIIVARLCGCKVIGHIRSLQRQVKLRKSTLDTCTCLICTSDFVLDDVRNLNSTTTPIRIYDPIDVLRFDTDGLDIGELKIKYGAFELDIILASVAILDPRKGHDTAILVLNELLKVNKKFKLFIVGGPIGNNSEENRLKKLATDLNIQDYVVFTGQLNSVVEMYAISNFILALSSDGEAFGRVPLEAAAARRVVIATRMGATPEIVTDMQTGFLIEPNNYLQAATHIVDLINSKEKSLFISENAYENVVMNFSANILVRNVESIYKTL
jgi:glycosyltransferase involved in cell wall biosynthesis